MIGTFDISILSYILVKRNNWRARNFAIEEWSVLFQIFRDVNLSLYFLRNVKLSVLNFFIFKKTSRKKLFFKILKDHHFLLGGRTNIIFWPVFRYFGALYKK